MGLALASIHIPKTAGTSFRVALEGWYGDALALHYPEAERVDPLDDRVALHGHLAQAAMPDADVTIAWFREPVARVVSHYHYWRRTQPIRQPSIPLHAAVLDGLPLLDFAEAMPNEQARYVHDPAVLDWLGVAERYDADLQSIATGLGFDAPEPAREMVSPTVNTITNVERREIMRLNRDDFELWRSACG